MKINFKEKLDVIVPVILAIAFIIGFFGIDALLSGNRPYHVNITVDDVSRPISKVGDLQDADLLWVPYEDYVIIPELDSEKAGGSGNLYAPEIVKVEGQYFMWYGAQSEDFHDSIHFATSTDGRNWTKYGTVLETGENNHVNDPSVVYINGTFYMYYTVAPTKELDEIWMSTSENGMDWGTPIKVLDKAEDAEQWDSLKVGRPTVLYEGGVFKMWFDGSQRNATDEEEVREETGRHIGYATSLDGFTWTKWAGNPVTHNSGAIDVEVIDGTYVLVEESQRGILYRIGSNETEWTASPQWLFHSVNNSFDPYGHVTPFILIENGEWVATYTGAATVKSWTENRISVWYPMKNISIVNSDDFSLDITEKQAWALSENEMKFSYMVYTDKPSDLVLQPYGGTKTEISLTTTINNVDFHFNSTTNTLDFIMFD